MKQDRTTKRKKKSEQHQKPIDETTQPPAELPACNVVAIPLFSPLAAAESVVAEPHRPDDGRVRERQLGREWGEEVGHGVAMKVSVVSPQSPLCCLLPLYIITTTKRSTEKQTV